MVGQFTYQRRSGRTVALFVGLITLAAVMAPRPGRASVGTIPAKHPSAASIRDQQGSGVQFDHGKPTINRQPVTPTQTMQKATEMLQGRGGFPMLLATAERMRLERSFPGKVMDWTPKAGPRASSHTLVLGDPYTEEWTWRDIRPAGDLNGDGLADVVNYESTVRYSYDGLITSTYELLTLKVSGRQGSNGTLLWQRDLLANGQNPYDTLIVPFGKDVTGDGKADLLERSVTVHSDKPAPCAILVCAGQGSASYSWTTRVLDGANGQAAWSQVLDGEASYTVALAYGVVAVAYVDAFSATNYLVDAAEAGDLNGDGLSDLVSNAYDTTGDVAVAGAGGLVAIAFVETYDSRDTTHMQALSGRSGEAFLTRNVELHNGWASARPVGDATADGRADLLWSETSWESSAHGAVVCAYSIVGGACERPGYAPSSTLSLLAAPSFSAAWSVNAPEVYGWLETSIGDLNGDGAKDIGFLGDYSSYAVDGKTGAVMWNRPYDGWYLNPFTNIGPVGGSPGDDLLMEFYTYDGNGNGNGNGSLSMDRIDGATGQLLFHTEHANPSSANSYGYIEGFVYGDGDGDGTTDVGIKTSIESYDSPSVSTLTVESGRTGVTLATDTTAHYEEYTPVGDLNGDGLADVLRSHGDYIYDTRAANSTALVMPSLTTLWTRTDPQVDWSDVQPMSNLDAAAGNEVLYSRSGPYDQSGRRPPERYDLLRGTTGEALWGEGDPFPGTGVESPGSISGSVTASGAAAAGICVTATSSTGELGYRRTATDGTYTIDGLRPGAFTVAFNNCGSSRYKPQWYPGVSDEQSAVPVAVAAGLVTQGIDAALGLKPAPANDNAADAILLQNLDSAQQEIGGATLEAGEPNCAGDASVWYRYNATGPQVPIFINLSGDFAKSLGVIDGATAFDSDPIRCSDSAARQDAEISFLPEDGHTYWIQVGVVGTRGNDMSITLLPAPRVLG